MPYRRVRRVLAYVQYPVPRLRQFPAVPVATHPRVRQSRIDVGQLQPVCLAAQVDHDEGGQDRAQSVPVIVTLLSTLHQMSGRNSHVRDRESETPQFPKLTQWRVVPCRHRMVRATSDALRRTTPGTAVRAPTDDREADQSGRLAPNSQFEVVLTPRPSVPMHRPMKSRSSVPCLARLRGQEVTVGDRGDTSLAAMPAHVHSFHLSKSDVLGFPRP